MLPYAALHHAILFAWHQVQRKNMSQVASKEYHEARRLLADKDFLKAAAASCRAVPRCAVPYYVNILLCCG